MFFKNNARQIKELRQGLEQSSIEIEGLERQNNIIKAMLGSMAEGVIAVDKNTKIISVNPSAEKIFKIERGESEGRLFLEAIRNNDIIEIINNVLENQMFISKELTLILPVQKVFQVNASPLFEKDRISGCLLVIHDITDIRKLEKIRSDFVANVSHELKTPLTSIKGFIETLLEGALDDKENNRQFLKIIQDHAQRLDSLVNDLLILSHLESRDILIKKSDFSLKVQVDQIILGFKTHLKEKNIKVENELPANLTVKADKNRIDQVFTNLIDNAVKFNKKNGFIKIYSHDIDSSIKITIEDSGMGIPQKDIPRIFERFYRVDKARSRELGGTGLGLSIVKHIVELHKGSVGVESIEGLGSKFHFVLPK